MRFGKRRFRAVLLGLAAAGLGLVAAAALWGWYPPWSDPAADDAPRSATGESLYVAHCAACHGERLEGQANWRQRRPDGRLPAPPHDRTGHTWHHSDDWLFNVTKHGVAPPLAPAGYQSDMQPFKDALTDAEIRAVLAFIKSTWPPQIRERQQRRSGAGTRQ